MSYFLPANKPLTWLLSSVATPTAIINPVPPNAKLVSFPNMPLKVRATGRAAINARANVENKKTTRERKANPVKEEIIQILANALKNY